MSALSSRSAHLSACTEISFRQMFEEALAEAEPGSATAAHIQALIDADDSRGSILKCADGCPILASAVERGRALADQYGWGQEL